MPKPAPHAISFIPLHGPYRLNQIRDEDLAQSSAEKFGKGPMSHVSAWSADRPTELVMSIDLRDQLHTDENPGQGVPEVLDATPQHSQARARRDHRRATRMLIALGAGYAMLFSDASPAGIEIADALYRGAFGGLIVWAASRSRRWTWSWLAGAAAVSAASLLTQGLALIAIAISVHALRNRRRLHLAGACVAVLSLPALLSQGTGPIWRLSAGSIEDPFAMSAIITLAATTPVIRSAWRTLSRRKRRQIKSQFRWTGIAISGILVSALALSGAAAFAMTDGLAELRAATQAVQDGDLSAASNSFDAAANDWEQANSIISGPWMLPSRLVPVLGQHVRAAQVVSGQSSALSASAALVTNTVNPDGLIVNGGVDLEEVSRITPTVDAFAATVDRATDRIGRISSPWLLPPVAQSVDRSMEILVPASGVLNAAAEGLHVGAGLLGQSQPSNTLIMFSTPAEARGSGGFVGNWALVQGSGGQVEIVEQFRTRELNALLEENAAELRADDEYVERYGRFEVERHIQDVTLSPDFPSVAPVAADLFTQATGTSVDAVLAVDPFVIEKLLEFSGPLDRDDGTSLTSSNATHELLVEQYERFGTDEAGREAELSALTIQLVDALLDSPPDPIAFASELAPLADQDRVSVWLADDIDGSIATRLGLDGAFPQTNGDLFSLVHQNSGQNKIDTFLEREVEIATQLDPENNSVVHDVTVTLNNTAASTGLPPAIIESNDQGLDRGTNRMMLSFYSALPVTSAQVNGIEQPLQVEDEFGYTVNSIVLAIPANDFATIDLQIAGNLDLSRGYDMTFGSQPTVAADLMSWHISTTNSDRIIPPQDWASSQDGVRWFAALDKDRTLTFAIDR